MAEDAMTFLGYNMYVVGKGVGIEVAQLGTYVLAKTKAVTVYESEEVNELLSLSPYYLNHYNAWMTLPGYYIGFSATAEATIEIKGKNLVYPYLPIGRDLVSAPDLFTFITLKFSKLPRPFDIVYTMARMNKLSMEDLIKKYATVW